MISSSSNPHFRRWKSLLTPQGVKKHGEFLLFGKKVVDEALTKYQERIVDRINTETLSKDLFAEIDIFGTRSEILVLKTPELPTWENKNLGLTLLCPLGDPTNLGSLIRSASAFAVDEIVLLKEATTPFHPKAVRAASGTLFDIKFSTGPSLNEVQPQDNWYALDVNGKPVDEIEWPESVVLLVGEEGPGVGSSIINKASIPISKNVESLNASTATAIAMYEIGKKRKGAILA